VNLFCNKPERRFVLKHGVRANNLGEEGQFLLQPFFVALVRTADFKHLLDLKGIDQLLLGTGIEHVQSRVDSRGAIEDKDKRIGVTLVLALLVGIFVAVHKVTRSGSRQNIGQLVKLNIVFDFFNHNFQGFTVNLDCFPSGVLRQLTTRTHHVGSFCMFMNERGSAYS